jgi:hypothetical protein
VLIDSDSSGGSVSDNSLSKQVLQLTKVRHPESAFELGFEFPKGRCAVGGDNEVIDVDGHIHDDVLEDLDEDTGVGLALCEVMF